MDATYTVHDGFDKVIATTPTVEDAMDYIFEHKDTLLPGVIYRVKNEQGREVYAQSIGSPAQVVHEYNEHGHHRLVVNGEAGEWASYRTLAVKGPFRAVTMYYGWGEDSPFPSEVFLMGEPFPCKTREYGQSGPEG